MAVIHYDPYFDENDEAPELSACGTLIGETYQADANFKNVTCKRCLKKRNLLVKSYQKNEKEIIKQMGDMAEFFKSNNSQY